MDIVTRQELRDYEIVTEHAPTIRGLKPHLFWVVPYGRSQR